jgi:membrane associated rhomboid family serine protease
MERINYCFDSNIFIDTCKTCKGVWLDAHEAPQIAAYLNVDDPRELAARALCEEVTQSERTHAALNVASIWFTVFFSIIPLPDPDELRLLPYVVWGLILANVLMMVAYTNADAEAARFFVTFGANCAKLGQGRTLYTIFSHAFVHTNFFHIFGNLLFLLACGPIIENAVGHARFLMLYVLLAACALLPYYDQNITLVGASGAIAGLMGFTLAAFPLRRIHIINTFGAMELPALYVIGAWFLVQVLYSSFFHLAGSRADVGFDAHLAGFAAGLLLGLLHRRSRQAEPSRPAAA